MRSTLLSGAIAGITAALAFLILHAIVIVPVWFAAGSGLLWGALGGAVIAAALYPVTPRPLTPRRGLVLGLLLWGSIAVPCLCEFLLRLGTTSAEILEVVVALASAASYGAAVTYRLKRTPLAAGGGAVAAMMMIAAASGPLIHVTGRGVAIYLSLLLVTVTFGMTMAYLLRRVTPQEARNEQDAGDLHARGGVWRRRFRTGT
ncbi:MAG: hypothetical protein AABO58_23780 [Acidobacteriota bacterium]